MAAKKLSRKTCWPENATSNKGIGAIHAHGQRGCKFTTNASKNAERSAAHKRPDVYERDLAKNMPCFKFSVIQSKTKREHYPMSRIHKFRLVADNFHEEIVPM